jgi:hypothetical protein
MSSWYAGEGKFSKVEEIEEYLSISSPNLDCCCLQRALSSDCLPLVGYYFVPDYAAFEVLFDAV